MVRFVSFGSKESLFDHLSVLYGAEFQIVAEVYDLADCQSQSMVVKDLGAGTDNERAYQRVRIFDRLMKDAGFEPKDEVG